jgi:hypothetical protein
MGSKQREPFQLGTSERWFLLFCHSETSSKESVSATIFAWVPSGISRTPSLSASASARSVEPTEFIQRAEAARKRPSLPRSTAPVAPVQDSCKKAPSVFSLKRLAPVASNSQAAASRSPCYWGWKWRADHRLPVPIPLLRLDEWELYHVFDHSD